MYNVLSHENTGRTIWTQPNKQRACASRSYTSKVGEENSNAKEVTGIMYQFGYGRE
jgi:hypothetical protein